MRDSLPDIGKVIGLNGAVLALVNLTNVKDIVSIIAGLVSITGTLLIIRNNLRKQKP